MSSIKRFIGFCNYRDNRWGLFFFSNRFPEEHMNWLRMLKDQVLNGFHIELEDLDFILFNPKGDVAECSNSLVKKWMKLLRNWLFIFLTFVKNKC
ncbi:MAG: hypothetical protein COC06_11965 [Bacteroidales bacterium]|nr:MAG: hypothetical protein COC06_11965 [Bacteroidales bacterium]